MVALLRSECSKATMLHSRAPTAARRAAREVVALPPGTHAA